MKRFLIALSAFFIALAWVSCHPVLASAVDIGVGEQTQINNYLDGSAENLNQIDFQLDTDADGKRSIRLKLYTLQRAALDNQSNFYDNIDFSAAPDTGTVSGTASGGLYRSRLDNQLHAVSYNPVSFDTNTFPVSIPAAYTSDEFTISLSYPSGQNAVAMKIQPFTDGQKLGYSLTSMGAIYGLTFTASGGSYFSTYSVSSSPPRQIGFQFTNSTPPTLPVNLLQNVGGYTSIAGNSVSVSLPPGNYDSRRPWDYWNNTLLPYIQQEFPDMQEFVLPEYAPLPEPSTIPTEFPTLPGFDYAMETTSTVDDQVGYQMPEIPTKPVPVPVFDFNSINSIEILSPVQEYLTGIWALITDVLTEYNLFPYVGIAVLCAIIAILLTLGR